MFDIVMLMLKNVNLKKKGIFILIFLLNILFGFFFEKVLFCFELLCLLFVIVMIFLGLYLIRIFFF